MDKQISAEDVTFKLFLDAVKRKDKMQFSYFSLYSAIKDADKIEINESNLKDEMVFEL